jgi:hypothetical protein
MHHAVAPARHQRRALEWRGGFGRLPVGRSKAPTFGHFKSPHLMSV